MGHGRRLSDTSKPGSVKSPNSNDSSGRQVTVFPLRDRPFSVTDGAGIAGQKQPFTA